MVPLPAPFRPTFTRHIAVSDTYSTYGWSHDFKEPRGGNYDTDRRIIISIQSLTIVRQPRRWLNESVELKKKEEKKMEIHEIQSRRGRGGNGRSDREGWRLFPVLAMKFLPKLLAARQSSTRTVTVSCLLSRSGSIVLNWYLCSETVNFSLFFHHRLHRFYIATIFILFLIFTCIIVHSICYSIRRFNRSLYYWIFNWNFSLLPLSGSC